jgi:Synergist-CTERM protein sorting domain-containing protein
VVAITSPSNGASVASSPVAIAGTVDDKTVTSVKISGKDAPASNGAFSAQVALVAGDNAITVTATNAGGTGSAAVHVSYAPPQTGVQGRVSSGGAAVQGAGVSLSPGGARAVTDAEGHYLISIAPGAYKLAVDAANYQSASLAMTVPADRIATLDVQLQPSSVPAAPHIRLDTPTEGQVFTAAKATVAGVAEIADLKSLSVNGESVTTAAGVFSVDVTLQPGANQIDVVAVRADGQTVEAHVGVSYKPAALAAASSGCASAGLADLLALLPLAAFLRRRT